MPDHLHLIAAGRAEGSNAKVFIAKSKQFSGYEFKKRTGRILWQRYAYDRLISPETLITVVRYVLGNPVAAGLVKNPFDYPFIGSEAWDRAELESLMQDHRPKVGTPPPVIASRWAG